MTREEFADFAAMVCADCDAALTELAASGCSPAEQSAELEDWLDWLSLIDDMLELGERLREFERRQGVSFALPTAVG